HQRGVIRVIPLVVVPLDDLRGSGANVLPLTNDRMREGGLGREKYGEDCLVCESARRVFPTGEFGDNRPLLLLELVFRVDAEIENPVGFDIKSDRPAL